MPLKSILFAGLFVVCAMGALYAPIMGILGYVGHYCVGPERQWWYLPIRPLGLRVSFTLAIATAIGVALNWRKMRFGRSFLVGQEKLLLAFMCIVWFSWAISPETVGRYTPGGIDHPTIKFTKLVIFLLMLSHVVTDVKNLDRLFWVLVLGALVLGLQAYGTPQQAFVKGRLESVGGPDFSEANTLGGFLGAMLFVIAAQFIRSGWKGRILCFLAGGFATNAVVLTRSRGAVLGVAGGAALALLMSPGRHRRTVTIGLVLALLGGLYLSDEGFLDRTSTMTHQEEDRDRSSQSRIEIWRGGVKMLLANPLGVGPGNFYQSIGNYAPEHPGRDAHSTFVRTAGELGWPGLAAFCAIVVNAAWTLRRVMGRARFLPSPHRENFQWMSFGLVTALAALLSYGLTGSLTYIECLWWLLVLPVCLQRALVNAENDIGSIPSADPGRSGKVSGQEASRPLVGRT